MKNSVSDQAFFIESEDYEEDKDSTRGEDDRNDSEFSNYSDDNPQHQIKPSSLNPSWPQSYRKSIDLYRSVPSSRLNFLGTPNLSRLGSSFLSSTLTSRHTLEIIPSLSKPFLPPSTDNQQPQERHSSSHSLLPPRGSSAKNLPHYHKYVLNGINVLCRVGLPSTPFAVKEGGWVGLSLLFIFGDLSLYTGILFRYCLDSQPGVKTYPCISQAAFGTLGCLIISSGGVIASILVSIRLFWVGFVDDVGFRIETTKTLNLSTFLVAIGIYGYCFSGHAVFPNIYTSIVKRCQFPMVLLATSGPFDQDQQIQMLSTQDPILPHHKLVYKKIVFYVEPIADTCKLMDENLFYTVPPGAIEAYRKAIES
ncbi:hypothetical protein Lser_V15G18978 [Lactuca serriola]